MVRFVAILGGVMLVSAASAQSTTPRSQSQPPSASSRNAEDPTDISAVPQKVQRWFGGAVDDILTGAGKVVDPNTGDPGTGKR